MLPPYPVADTPEARRDYCDYLESLSRADECLGEVMASLKENGLWDDTILLFTTDHGLAVPGEKCNMYDSGIGVAFILRRPGQKHAVCDALCSQIDLFPTVCDLLGVKKPEWLEGRSMMPLLDGNAEEINEFVFSEVTFHATYEPMRCVRSKRYKLIRFYDGGELKKAPNVDESAAKKLYFSTPLSRMPKPREMFFDLAADPGENVWTCLRAADLRRATSIARNMQSIPRRLTTGCSAPTIRCCAGRICIPSARERSSTRSTVGRRTMKRCTL